jgi:glyoxylate reductase
MKKTAYLINTSRGPVIDEAALVKALAEGTIRGAGLDVYEFEPKLAKGLAKLPNTILSPHIASAQMGAREEMSLVVAENVIDFLEGKTPRNKVNK